jgi:hypothetical protein
VGGLRARIGRGRAREQTERSADRPLTPEEVSGVYRVMLGRLPENDAAIENHINGTTSVLELVRAIGASPEFIRRTGIDVATSSPFLFPNTCVDVRGVITAHARPDPEPREGHVVNFLGVAIPVRAMAHLRGRGGELDPMPIPANDHADMAEWAAALRPLDLAADTFTMVELGCGWGCWMNNTGVAAKARGLAVHLIGVEGDERHLELARETLAVNGIAPDEYELIRGVAAASAGEALFPRQVESDNAWDSEPVFGASAAEIASAAASGRFEQLRMVPLAEALGSHRRVDLLHMDIQGGEADLVADTIELLTERVAYVVIGTHSRAIEGRLIETLLAAGWQLEIERPAIFAVVDGQPQTTVDGVQGWRNPRLDLPTGSDG